MRFMTWRAPSISPCLRALAEARAGATSTGAIQAGGLLRTSTPSTFNRRTVSARLYEHPPRRQVMLRNRSSACSQ